MPFFHDFFDKIQNSNAEEALSDQELANAGLSRHEYEQLANGVPGARLRYESMAALFKLGPEKIDADRSTALGIATRCAQCGLAHECNRAIAANSELPHETCPNASLYASLAKE